MRIRTIAPPEQTAVLALIEASLRRPGAATGPRDDFPVALSPGNAEGLFVLEEDGEIRACLSVLVRPFVTSAGEIPIATIGSVVTAPAHRRRGLSGQLQAAVLARLRDQHVPLAVLWSDRAEFYRARGFRAAGLEFHADLAPWGGATAPRERRPRPFQRDDISAVATLHARHPYRTRRRAGDDAALYGMPGTRGFVLEDAGVVTAYAFCGKGQDFPGYVLEWGGGATDVAALVAHARSACGAQRVLIPQGAEELATLLAGNGAAIFAWPSGLWTVLRPDLLERLVGPGADAGEEGAPAWLGGVDGDGEPRPGRLRLAVWGFDSI